MELDNSQSTMHAQASQRPSASTAASSSLPASARDGIHPEELEHLFDRMTQFPVYIRSLQVEIASLKEELERYALSIII